MILFETADLTSPKNQHPALRIKPYDEGLLWDLQRAPTIVLVPVGFSFLVNLPEVTCLYDDGEREPVVARINRNTNGESGTMTVG